jgi:hypothetical protein
VIERERERERERYEWRVLWLDDWRICVESNQMLSIPFDAVLIREKSATRRTRYRMDPIWCYKRCLTSFALNHCKSGSTCPTSNNIYMYIHRVHQTNWMTNFSQPTNEWKINERTKKRMCKLLHGTFAFDSVDWFAANTTFSLGVHCNSIHIPTMWDHTFIHILWFSLSITHTHTHTHIHTHSLSFSISLFRVRDTEKIQTFTYRI